MIRLKIEQSLLKQIRADVIAIFVPSDDKGFRSHVKNLKSMLGEDAAPLAMGSFKGKQNETLLLYPTRFKSSRLLLVGAGDSAKTSLETLRRSAATAAKEAQALKTRSLCIMLPNPGTVEQVESGSADLWENIGLALCEGAALSLYKFEKYFSKENKCESILKEVRVGCEERSKAAPISRGIRIAKTLIEATYLARDLENAPGNEIFPDALAKRAAASGRAYGFKVSSLQRQKMRQLGMGGLLGVAQGSDHPPRFIIMEYNRAKRKFGTVVLVGKGVTFDAGGISIKPAAGMGEMKMDMSGGAAVIGTMQAAAALRLPVHLVGLVPATENLLGGAAVKPGDILRHPNGKTSEVDNTDAEGRLILADALSYASRFQPDVVIDLATLTGACVVALGHYATGMMGNHQPTMDALSKSGERTYERVWQLPMFEEYEKLIKSDVADVKNVGGRWGGAIAAAMFLKHFIGKYNWVHLDIAGTAILEENLDYIPKGGSGVGVRLLVDFLRHRKGKGGTI
ncbi:MAG TPA: leucyl aminopeptidase [Bacteroidota bacterium]